MQMIVINTDGGARGNPGPAGLGVFCSENGDELFSLKEFLGHQTNNWAEYEALIRALEELKRRGLHERPIEVRMDSELVVKQMLGQYKVKDAGLKVQNAKVRGLLAAFAQVSFVHVPRERNKEADRLVNEAIDASM